MPRADDSPTVVDADDLAWTEQDHGRFGFRRKRLGAAADGGSLGCSLYELPPGKTAWPYHYHAGNEEAFFVLAGEATLRTPDGERTVTAGDYVALPSGEAGAHQFTNESDEPVRYLAVSTMNEPDVMRYPDSEKVGIFAGAAPGGASDERTISGFFPESAAVDLWEGED